MRSLIICLMLATASMTAATAVSAVPAQATPEDRKAPVPIHYRTAKIEGLDIFYREAGPAEAPVVLLLHGFPTSSHMFRNLIPLLADRYHVIAPDYPGYGQSASPDRSKFAYTFGGIANIVDKLLDHLAVKSYTMYVMDYGAPVGYRLALKHPERVSGLIIQNGNAYEEGLKEFWDPIKTYWSDGSEKSREALSGLVTLETTKFQYPDGMEDVSRISPDNWVHDQALLDRPGNKDIQLDMLYDYRTNVPLYPDFQSFFRERKPPTLIVWGKNDHIFPEAGAHPYLKDLPDAEIHILSSGHFLLEEKLDVAAPLINDFLDRNVAEK
ncbi:alpha/beta hydrolase [Rhizobium sp. 007]|uniref:alpha/beta fold hydrolase n=1 Tax=Rhizobium sp. 007 TaxID=2785056 RepID=UPI00188DE78A|nr:alpha/beta hydrolase [Rhizobium sp. 007]QPB22261.1 alpha/beta hydrolase [Rhizobium sp. 007]